jgi:hypothetical protein
MSFFLRKNMRRFGTKNLHEAADAVFTGNLQADLKSPEFKSMIVTLDGKKHQLIVSPQELTLSRTQMIAKQESAYIPTRAQAADLASYVKPSVNSLIIWVDQGTDVPQEMQYVQIDLGGGGFSDFKQISATDGEVISYNDQPLNQTELNITSEYVVLLRDEPQRSAVTVRPK